LLAHAKNNFTTFMHVHESGKIIVRHLVGEKARRGGGCLASGVVSLRGVVSDPDQYHGSLRSGRASCGEHVYFTEVGRRESVMP